MAACWVAISSGSHQVFCERKTPRATENRKKNANQSQPRRRSTAAAKKQQEMAARIDIQRQGNCTKRNLGRKFQSGVLRRNITRTEAKPSTSKLPQTDRRVASEDVLPASLREHSAVIAVSKINATAQSEEIQLNQVCSASSIRVKRKFCEGSRPLDRACPMLTQRCS